MKRIRLTESQLHRLIEQALNEWKFWDKYIVGNPKAYGRDLEAERIASQNDPRQRRRREKAIDDYEKRERLSNYRNQKRISNIIDNGERKDRIAQRERRNLVANTPQMIKSEQNESLARRVTESVVRKLRKLNEDQIGNGENGLPIYDMGCDYKDADFNEITQIIGDCTGREFKGHFFNNNQWDSNDLQTKISFKFNDIDGYLVATVGGGYTILYDGDEEDEPIGLEIWMGMGNYSVGEESANGHYDPWSDLSKDMTKKVDWEKVERIIGSYSIDSPTPEFLDAFDTGMEKQVLGYDRETSQRARPSAPQFI